MRDISSSVNKIAKELETSSQLTLKDALGSRNKAEFNKLMRLYEMEWRRSKTVKDFWNELLDKSEQIVLDANEIRRKKGRLTEDEKDFMKDYKKVVKLIDKHKDFVKAWIDKYS